MRLLSKYAQEVSRNRVIAAGALAVMIGMAGVSHAQEPVRVFIGNPDCSLFDVPAQGEVRFPLWIEMPEPIGGGVMRLVIADPVVAEWLDVDFYYPWQHYVYINGDILTLSFLPTGSYPDSLLHVADLQFRMDADSSRYGQSVQAIVATNMTFVDTTGWFSFGVDYCVSPLCIECQTSINDTPQLPDEISHTAYPNPFNSSVTISFALPHDGEAAVTIYDIMGRRVRTLSGGILRAGTNSIVWDATDDSGAALSSGVYFYRINCDIQGITSKITLLR
jgi:hypothetical protein